MQEQKSFNQDTEWGSLYLVPTPIGNLEDMTFRAINILKEVDVIAAEDTRESKKLCNYFEIDTHLISYHEHNKESSGHKILELMKQGKNVALISDAGMPIISDPGSQLVDEILAENGKVIPLPGANAALTALVASGITPQPFFFFGFLERQKKEKKKQLEQLSKRTETMIFYESPHRLKETLAVMSEILGNRRICLSRELTKRFEEFVRGTISDAVKWSEENQIRGEFCLIVEGRDENDVVAEEEWWDSMTLEEHVNHYVSEGYASKEAIKQVAKERSIPKRDVYQSYHVDQ
ncbi:16S rRNA (cytidine(1402)-2'-O)-methyltransferase [Metabacillus idriensis]|uniref:Ribosomal RNA small subunit methyltransferase I n=1 Tax=Metabacillus idriensis TaxID=324768 RepID=A0A6I2MF99_9BACI|nr:16S rRNA (cytidine(1402)-2'-O)-methyltransferase [Metabacillus idriensis]MCM3598958.1 16S rRNA (cytidine(1402)-2'-O)-methyltransferase [Metabacillus idriensis]MRX57030.1 16S rRNA (cytidine(1402)-2'-O)-methyltransferase [Metabacillus idriensis]